MRLLRNLLLFAMAALFAPHPAAAQTVDEIVSRGTINIGVLVDLPPYGLLNAQRQRRRRRDPRPRGAWLHLP